MKSHTADRAGVGCVALVVALLGLGLTGGAAVAAPATPAGAPVLECSALASMEFSHLPDASSQVSSATPVTQQRALLL